MAGEAPQGISGSDESFISFAFAIVSLVALCMYLPLVVSTLKYIVDFVLSVTGMASKKKSKYDDDVESPLKIIYGYVSHVPKVLLFFAKNPLTLKEGFHLCLAEKSFSFMVCLPRFLRFCFRPKVFILWLWFILFSSAMYATLTFDAHGILGVSSQATTGEIKKAYRKLTKINHPDHNKTETARVIYNNVRKAYKALVDKEAFEAEMAQEEQFTVGIALPRWMTNRDNDTLVLFSLLGVLLGLPLLIWYKFRGNDHDRLQEHITAITQYEGSVEVFLGRLGIPQDVRLLEKRRSRTQVLATLRACSLGSANMTEADVMNMPNFLEFKNRCKNLSQFKGPLLALGFDEDGLARLNEYFEKNPDAGSELETPLEEQEFVRIGDAQYKATRFMLEQLINHINAAADSIDALFKGELRTTRRIRNHHRDILDTIDLLYTADKRNQNTVKNLTEAARRGDELVKELPIEMNGVIKKMQQNYLQSMGYGNAKQQKKMMQQQQRMMSAGGYSKASQRAEEVGEEQ